MAALRRPTVRNRRTLAAAVDELVKRGVPARIGKGRIVLTGLPDLPPELQVSLLPTALGPTPYDVVRSSFVHVRVSRDCEMEVDDALRYGQWLAWKALHAARFLERPPPRSPANIVISRGRKKK